MQKLLVHPNTASIVHLSDDSTYVPNCKIIALAKMHEIPIRNLSAQRHEQEKFIDQLPPDCQQIVVFGSRLEYEVTSFALLSVGTGLHVFLVVDRVLCMAPENKAICLERLFPYGVIPILESQLIHEVVHSNLSTHGHK